MFIVRKQFNKRLDEQSFCSESQAILVAHKAWKTGGYHYITVISAERNETVIELGTNPSEAHRRAYA
jgi:hypothetical protein